MSKQVYGLILALVAAAINGLVGILSINLFSTGLEPVEIAFYKAFLGFCICFFVVLIKGQRISFKHYIQTKTLSVVVCSLLGFFMLYFFETAAYAHTRVAVVLFILFGASTITTFALNCLLELRWFRNNEMIALFLSLLGLFLIFLDTDWQGEPLGLLYASLAGLGYGGFLVLTQHFRLGSGLIPLTALLFFGAIYLSLPAVFGGTATIPSSSTLLPLLALALLPTIGGFWCTTESLTMISSQEVQLVELIEPIFGLVFAFIFLRQRLAISESVGGCLIIAAICIFNYLEAKV